MLAILAAALLFPEPLHLVRRIDDPIAQTVFTVDEYRHGNRIITARGNRVVIADFARREVTVVDRAASTYSIAPMDPAEKVPPDHTVVITFESAGETITVRNEVVRSTKELPPSDLLIVPPGARRVETPAVALPRLLKELE